MAEETSEIVFTGNGREAVFVDRQKGVWWRSKTENNQIQTRSTTSVSRT